MLDAREDKNKHMYVRISTCVFRTLQTLREQSERPHSVILVVPPADLVVRLVHPWRFRLLVAVDGGFLVCALGVCVCVCFWGRVFDVPGDTCGRCGGDGAAFR